MYICTKSLKSYTNLYFLFMSRRGPLCHAIARLLVMPKARHPHLVIHKCKFIFIADSGGSPASRSCRPSPSSLQSLRAFAVSFIIMTILNLKTNLLKWFLSRLHHCPGPSSAGF